jgi:hypothetical protein
VSKGHHKLHKNRSTTVSPPDPATHFPSTIVPILHNEGDDPLSQNNLERAFISQLAQEHIRLYNCSTGGIPDCHPTIYWIRLSEHVVVLEVVIRMAPYSSPGGGSIGARSCRGDQIDHE